MNKLLYIVSSISVVASAIDSDWTIELRGAYVHPTSNLVQEIYRSHAGDIEFEASRKLCNEWRAWANINYWRKKGKSRGFCHNTKLQVIPLSVGIKYERPFCNCLFNENVSWYLGFGGSVTFIKICDDSEFVHRYTSKAGGGFTVKSGVNWSFTECMFLDFFIDYHHQKMNFCSDACVERYSLNSSSVKIGAGIGLNF